MQISSRFTIAVHVLVCIETFKNDRKATSDFLPWRGQAREDIWQQ